MKSASVCRGQTDRQQHCAVSAQRRIDRAVFVRLDRSCLAIERWVGVASLEQRPRLGALDAALPKHELLEIHCNSFPGRGGCSDPPVDQAARDGVRGRNVGQLIDGKPPSIGKLRLLWGDLAGLIFGSEANHQ